ncbi:MAG: hypothetical protein ACTSUE_22770 [Promethearchaeota archaeon]
MTEFNLRKWPRNKDLGTTGILRQDVRYNITSLKIHLYPFESLKKLVKLFPNLTMLEILDAPLLYDISDLYDSTKKTESLHLVELRIRFPNRPTSALKIDSIFSLVSLRFLDLTFPISNEFAKNPFEFWNGVDPSENIVSVTIKCKSPVGGHVRNIVGLFPKANVFIFNILTIQEVAALLNVPTLKILTVDHVLDNGEFSERLPKSILSRERAKSLTSLDTLSVHTSRIVYENVIFVPNLKILINNKMITNNQFVRDKGQEFTHYKDSSKTIIHKRSVGPNGETDPNSMPPILKEIEEYEPLDILSTARPFLNPELDYRFVITNRTRKANDYGNTLIKNNVKAGMYTVYRGVKSVAFIFDKLQQIDNLSGFAKGSITTHLIKNSNGLYSSTSPLQHLDASVTNTFQSLEGLWTMYKKTKHDTGMINNFPKLESLTLRNLPTLKLTNMFPPDTNNKYSKELKEWLSQSSLQILNLEWRSVYRQERMELCTDYFHLAKELSHLTVSHVGAQKMKLYVAANSQTPIFPFWVRHIQLEGIVFAQDVVIASNNSIQSLMIKNVPSLVNLDLLSRCDELVELSVSECNLKSLVGLKELKKLQVLKLVHAFDNSIEQIIEKSIQFIPSSVTTLHIVSENPPVEVRLVMNAFEREGKIRDFNIEELFLCRDLVPPLAYHASDTYSFFPNLYKFYSSDPTFNEPVVAVPNLDDDSDLDDLSWPGLDRVKKGATGLNKPVASTTTTTTTTNKNKRSLVVEKPSDSVSNTAFDDYLIFSEPSSSAAKKPKRSSNTSTFSLSNLNQDSFKDSVPSAPLPSNETEVGQQQKQQEESVGQDIMAWLQSEESGIELEQTYTINQNQRPRRGSLEFDVLPDSDDEALNQDNMEDDLLVNLLDLDEFDFDLDLDKFVEKKEV